MTVANTLTISSYLIYVRAPCLQFLVFVYLLVSNLCRILVQSLFSTNPARHAASHHLRGDITLRRSQMAAYGSSVAMMAV